MLDRTLLLILPVHVVFFSCAYILTGCHSSPHETHVNTVLKVLTVACNSTWWYGWCDDPLWARLFDIPCWSLEGGVRWLGELSSPGLTVWSLYIKLWQPANLSNFLSASHPVGFVVFDPFGFFEREFKSCMASHPLFNLEPAGGNRCTLCC